MGRVCSHNGKVAKSTGNIVLGNSRCRWEYNIKTDIKETSVNRRIGLIRFRIGITGEPF